MEKQFTRLQLFNLTDGRLSTSMSDVYETLNHIFNTSFTTIGLISGMEQLKKANPEWFKNEVKFIENLKKTVGDDFNTLVTHIENNCNNLISVNQF